MSLEESVVLALERAESALARGGTLKGTGFWAAVAKLRRDPDLARKHAERVGRIDTSAFEKGVRLRVPAAWGTLILSAGTVGGMALVAGAAAVRHDLIASVVFLAGVLVLLITTHSLVHWAVGRLVGMRFTHYFLGGPPPPRPGVKVDYATYLRVPPRTRALMHASGALVTKAIPFLMMPAGMAAGVRPWAIYALAGVGLLQIVTDAVFSTKTSDWKKVRRELSAAASIGSPRR